MTFLPKLFQAATIAVLISFFILSSCDDNPDFGQDLIPDSDRVSGFLYDQSIISSKTVPSDSIEISEEIYSTLAPFNLLGSYFDPVFGTTTASFLTQVRLSGNLVVFEDNMVPDSLILLLHLVDKYGDFRQSTPMEIKVFALSESIELDSTYYSPFPVDDYYMESEQVGSFIVYPSNSDTIVRIPIDLNYYLDWFTDTAVMKDNDSFSEKVKGFYLKTNPVNQGGQILSFNPISDYSLLSFYYHYENETASPIRPASSVKNFNFLINNECARIAIFDHEYETAWTPIQALFDSTYEDSYDYIQMMGGPRVNLVLEDIEAWKDSLDYVVVKAELFIPIAEGSDNFFDPPLRLSLQLLNLDGSLSPLGDLYPYATASPAFDYFDGNYNSNQKYYRFNMAKHIQEIMRSETENLPIVLFPYRVDNSVRANRVIIDKEKIKLNIQYLK